MGRVDKCEGERAMIDGVRFNPFKLQRRSFLRKTTFIFFFLLQYNIALQQYRFETTRVVLTPTAWHLCVQRPDNGREFNTHSTRYAFVARPARNVYIYVRICQWFFFQKKKKKYIYTYVATMVPRDLYESVCST